MHKIIVCLLILSAIVVLGLYRRGVLAKKLTVTDQFALWTMIGGIIIMYFPCMTEYLILGKYTTDYLNQIADRLGTSAQYFSLTALLAASGFSLVTSYKLMLLTCLCITALTAVSASRKLAAAPSVRLCLSLLYLVNPLYLNCLYSEGRILHCIIYAFFPLALCLICRMIPQCRSINIQNMKSVLAIVTAVTIIITIYQTNRLLFETPPYYPETAQETFINTDK